MVVLAMTKPAILKKSVQHRSQCPTICSPLQYQALQLRGLQWVLFSDAIEDANLLGDHPHQINDLARGAAGQMTSKRAAAEDDALVGFFWGHDMVLGKEADGNKPS